MYLVKGLLIFSPVFVYQLGMLEWIEKRRKLITWIFGITISIIVLSPFSFIGWLPDYIVFSIGATFILKTFATGLTGTRAIIVRVMTTLLLIGYVIITSLFGARLLNKYEKGNLTFRVYRIPDMVSAPTHILKITQVWGVIEKFEIEERVRRADRLGANCNYDFDLVTRVIKTDNCKD